MASGIKLTSVKEGTPIVLAISSEGKALEMGGSILKVLQENVALISVNFAGNQKLNFNNVKVDMECITEDNIPAKWANVKIMFYQNQYVLRADTDGKKKNRRECFRVGVSHRALMKMPGKGQKDVMIKDISLSGFAITDKDKSLNLVIGDQLAVHFEDLGHVLDLIGVVVRTQEEEDYTIYGLQICNICKDLSSYICVKQRSNKT